MANDMGSWRSMASSATRSIKGYVAQRDWKRGPYSGGDQRADQPADGTLRPSIRQWAGQTLRALAQPGAPNAHVEKLAMFPGWAHRKYHDQLIDTADDSTPFDVEMFVSGYASQFNSAGFYSRSGRTFLFAAKMFAALPKVVAEETIGAVTGNRPTDSAVDDLIASMGLPPKPEDMTDEAEAQALVEQIRDLSMDTASVSTNASSSSSIRSDVSSNRNSNDSDTILRLHKNLETRFLPFVSSSLSGRPIRIAIYATDPEQLDFKSPPLGYVPDEDYAAKRSPLLAVETVTGADGSFQTKVRIPWHKMCTHPAALHIAFGYPVAEHTFYVAADLMAVPSRPPSPGAQLPYAVRTLRTPRNLPPVTTTYLKIPITYTTIRLISDIDDTVKMSGILSGAKVAFYNVFAKDLSESIIPGMGDWYSDMWKRGVRFHYVSNSPFELLPVINEFMTLSRLPPGSLKLRSYSGRRILSELFRAPAERKRAGIMDILDNFPDGRFFLVGDSGEQDLELFATIAKERPQQVLAVFIRDASTWESVKPLEDPTGSQTPNMPQSLRRISPPVLTPGDVTPTTNGHHSIAGPKRSMSGDITPSTPSYAVRQTRRSRTTNLLLNTGANAASEADYFPPSPLSSSPMSESPPMNCPPPAYPPPAFARVSSTQRQNSDVSTSSAFSLRPSVVRQLSNGSSRAVPQMTEAERKQYDLQMRVYRARSAMPDNVPLRIFREPTECVETKEILDQLNMDARQV
ncbi:hypothetical protein BC835DRAFT_1309756 [Cytidiella melzeri]|nr:hypothetical protein BC835DRAFT_1309756 [Cytidiella melzeri]